MTHQYSRLQKFIVVTRPAAKGRELCALIEARGGKALHFPTIAFTSSPDPVAFSHALSLLPEQEWLIFVSPQAVFASLDAIRKAWPLLLSQVKLAAVGEGTAQALQQAGFTHVLYPKTAWDSEHLVALPELQALANKKIAIIRGAGGRDFLEKTLLARGAKVLNVIAYQRIIPTVNVEPIVDLLKQHRIAAFVCTSMTGVENLRVLLGESSWPFLKDVLLVVISERIKLLALDLGFQTICVAHNASHSVIIDCLEKQKQKKERS